MRNYFHLGVIILVILNAYTASSYILRTVHRPRTNTLYKAKASYDPEERDLLPSGVLMYIIRNQLPELFNEHPPAARHHIASAESEDIPDFVINPKYRLKCPHRNHITADGNYLGYDEPEQEIFNLSAEVEKLRHLRSEFPKSRRAGRRPGKVLLKIVHENSPSEYEENMVNSEILRYLHGNELRRLGSKLEAIKKDKKLKVK